MILFAMLFQTLVYQDKIYYLQTYTKDNGFIITQYPSHDNVVEFIRLIVDYECRTVICLDPLHLIKSVCLSFMLSSRQHYKCLLPLVSMPYCSLKCSLYVPTYSKNTIYVTIFYKAVFFSFNFTFMTSILNLYEIVLTSH